MIAKSITDCELICLVTQGARTSARECNHCANSSRECGNNKMIDSRNNITLQNETENFPPKDEIGMSRNHRRNNNRAKPLNQLNRLIQLNPKASFHPACSLPLASNPYESSTIPQPNQLSFRTHLLKHFPSRSKVKLLL